MLPAVPIASAVCGSWSFTYQNKYPIKLLLSRPAKVPENESQLLYWRPKKPGRIRKLVLRQSSPL